MSYHFKFILIIFLVPIFSFGQKMETKDYVKSLFKNHSKIQWIKHYKGRIDDLNDVSVTLGFDGETCKGRLTYLRSNLQFDLIGSIVDRQIYLEELDSSKKVSGSLEGKFLKNTISGNWSNYNNSKGGNLLLTETDQELKFPSYCGDNKWIRKYQGAIGKDRVEIILQKESTDKVSGFIFYSRKNKTFAFKGDIDEQDNIILKVKDQLGGNIQTINGNLQKDQLTIAIKNGDQKEFTPSDGLTIGCIEYADYMTGYDITFPKTTNAAFNQSMNEETEAWVQACRTHATKIKKQSTSTPPQKRATERGYAWSEVAFFNKNIISGFMTYSNTWTPGQKLIAFNFDFEKNSSLYLEDIFEKKKDFKKYIKNYIKKEIKDHKYYSNSDFKKWVKKNEFSYFTIRQEGICFSTKFHMLYGRQSITIPYQQLKPFLKKSFLKSLKGN